jgi:hypothetical protein
VLRLLAAVLGLALLAAVLFLGLHVTDGPFYVIWFGLASALIAPLGLTDLALHSSGVISESSKNSRKFRRSSGSSLKHEPKRSVFASWNENVPNSFVPFSKRRGEKPYLPDETVSKATGCEPWLNWM